MAGMWKSENNFQELAVSFHPGFRGPNLSFRACTFIGWTISVALFLF